MGTKSKGEGPTKGLRISELARRGGVSRATIHYYVRLGLLPPPKKTARTMGYYNASSVARIQMIRELQNRFLPLAVIKQKLAAEGDDDPGRQLALVTRLSEELRSVIEPNEHSLERRRVPAETGLTLRYLDQVERMGLVRSSSARGTQVFGPADVAILRAIGKMNRAGLDEPLGFLATDLSIYQESMAALIAREVDLFTRRVAGRASRHDLGALARAAVTGATELLLALRYKMVGDLLAATAARPRRHSSSTNRRSSSTNHRSRRR